MPERPGIEPSLKRSISLPQLAFYGIGTILGAGIYVLLGEVALLSGYLTPWAFLMSAIVVSLSAYSYAQLSRKYPFSAGEAVYIQAAFNHRLLSSASGIAVVLAGIVSSATLLNGFAGYLEIFIKVPELLTITIISLILFGITAWGVTQSVNVAVFTTLIEIVGLLMVIYVSKTAWLDLNWNQFKPDLSPTSFHGITAGAFLAFYAFIGFEDMVNMAEEVKNPTFNMPVGILIALITTAVLYELTALSALLSVPLEELAGSPRPLALVIEKNSDLPLEIIGLISLVAIINGAMIQVIMASRVLYGMARKNLFFKQMGRINPTTRTPLIATIAISIVVWVFAVTLPLASLAQLTSAFILFVFCLVNFGLFIINLRERNKGFISLVIPIAGALSCATLLVYKLLS